MDADVQRYRELISSPVINGEQAQKYVAEVWHMSAAEYREKGTYRKAANHLPRLSAGQIHLDLGAGFGELMGHLALRDKNAHLVGIDHNNAIAEKAIPALRAEFGSRVKALGKGIISTPEYLPAEPFYIKYDRNIGREAPFEARFEHADIPEVLPEGISYIIGDFRNRELLRKILGDNKVQSASIMTPGMIKPFENHPTDPAFMRDVGNLLTEKVTSGGVALVSQRIRIPSDDVEKNLPAALRYFVNCILGALVFGDHMSEWRLNSFEHLSANSKGQPIADVLCTLRKK